MGRQDETETAFGTDERVLNAFRETKNYRIEIPPLLWVNAISRLERTSLVENVCVESHK